MSAYSTLILGDGPRAYWRLGESGFPYNDSSGNGAGFTAGQFGGTLAPGQTSLLNSDPADLSMGFPTGWLSRGTVAALNVGDVFSLEAWVKLNTLTNPNMAIYCHWTSSLYLRINSANKLELVQLGVKVVCASTVAITDLNTHHVVATKNGATVKLYLDGVDVTGSISNFTFSTAPTWMAIGAPSSGSEYANMTMDEVAIYPVVLSQAQVLAHYNAGVAPPPPPQTVQVDSVYPPGYAKTIVGTFNVGDGHLVGGVPSGQFGAVTAVRSLAQSIADTVALGDQTTRARALTRTVADPLALADAVSRSRTVARAIADALALADALVRSRDAARTVGDTVALSDAQTISRTLARAAGSVPSAQAFGAPLIQASGGGFVPSVPSAQAFGVPSVTIVSRSLTQTLADTLALSDTGVVAWSASRPKNDTVGLSDLVTPVKVSGGVTQAVTGLASAQAFGALTPKASITKLVGGVSSAQAFTAPLAVPKTTVPVSGLGSAQAFGTLKTNQRFAVGGLGSAQQFGTPLPKAGFPQTVSVAGIDHGHTFLHIVGTKLVGQELVGFHVLDEYLFGRPGFKIRFQISGLGSAQAFGRPGLAVWIPVLGLGSAQAFGQPYVYRSYLHDLPGVDLGLTPITCQDVVLAEIACGDETLLVPSEWAETLTASAEQNMTLVPSVEE